MNLNTMKHAILTLLSLFCLSAKAQVHVGYSFAQTQLSVGGEITFTADDNIGLLMRNDDGVWAYYSNTGGSIVTDVVLDPSPSGYKRWLSTLNNEWIYLGYDTFKMPLANGESLYGRRFFAEESGKYFFRFW